MKTRLYNALVHSLRRPVVRKLLIASGVLLLAGGLTATAAVVEYRTNTIAAYLGDWLNDTNRLRPKRGGIWEGLDALADAEAGLATTPNIELPEQGLPEVVRRNRFGYRRAPEDGTAGYAVVWMEEASGAPETRPIQDILESYRNYRIGMQIVDALDLPNARFRAQALAEASSIYGQLSTVETIDSPAPEPDDTISTAVSPDSSRQQVLEELAVDIIHRLRDREQSALVEQYHNGGIEQIEVHQALGEYAGTLTLSQSRIRFTLGPEDAIHILAPIRPFADSPIR